jgi:UDP-glucose 4-epimerase
MRHYCLIGGSGFIGHHLAVKLVSMGKRVTVIEKKRVPDRPLPKSTNYLVYEGHEKAFLKKALEGVNCVVHLAYSTVPKTSFEHPLKDIRTNLPSLVNFFEVCSELSLDKVVMLSSGGTVYGVARTIPITEEHPTNPISPYGITKLAMEKYALMYNSHYRLPVVIVRPGNAFGEGQLASTGQGFIATALSSILSRKEILMFGESGTVRDYLHVSDVVSGIVAAAEYGKIASCYNIGSGIGRNNREVLDVIYPLAAVRGLEPMVRIVATRKFDVPVNVLDSHKLTNDTGWRSALAFEDGMKRVWDWYCEETEEKSRNHRRRSKAI